MISFNNMWMKLRKFIGECRRVLKVTKKPTREELTTIIKASGLGMIVIGLIGFTIAMLKQLFFAGGF